MGVYTEIHRRLKAKGISLEKYIYINPKTQETTLKIKETTLDGISFIAKNSFNLSTDKSIIGNHALEAALSNSKSFNGLRTFAGQILKEDLENTLLQLSFLATKGKGFREIFYLPEETVVAMDSKPSILLDQDNKMFDLKFGKMIDSPDITSIHIDMTPGGKTKIHLDKQGFIFADRDGKIFTASNAGQHTIDELMLKDKFLPLFGKGAVVTLIKNNMSILSDIDLNSISDPTLGSTIMQNNQFLRLSSVRATLGLEGSYTINRTQLFGRATLGLEISKDIRPKILKTDCTFTAGLRGTHNLLGSK